MIDRRDGLRRRIYLICLIVGIPILTVSWVVERSHDPFIALAYPPHIIVQVIVAVGLLRRRMRVHLAERIVLFGVVATYLSAVAVRVLGAEDLVAVHDAMTASSLLAITLMMMLAYVTFETSHAARIAVAIVGTYVGIVAVRLVPEAIAGRLGGGQVDVLTTIIALVAAVGLLHVLAQTKEQAAEARMHAASMTALANTDALTGIPNRRHLHAELANHLAHAQPDDDPVAVVLLDIDHFKQVNDTHGHDTGDAVLREVARTLTGAVRDRDVLGRWGGEEFLVIAPATDPEEAAALAERCRALLAARPFPPVGTVTASLGVATHQQGDTAWGLLRRADKALYQAKAAGRDQVAHHDDEGTVPSPDRAHSLKG